MKYGSEKDGGKQKQKSQKEEKHIGIFDKQHWDTPKAQQGEERNDSEGGAGRLFIFLGKKIKIPRYPFVFFFMQG